jgi:hypothetical protein
LAGSASPTVRRKFFLAQRRRSDQEIMTQIEYQTQIPLACENQGGCDGDRPNSSCFPIVQNYANETVSAGGIFPMLSSYASAAAAFRSRLRVRLGHEFRREVEHLERFEPYRFFPLPRSRIRISGIRQSGGVERRDHDLRRLSARASLTICASSSSEPEALLAVLSGLSYVLNASAWRLVR